MNFTNRRERQNCEIAGSCLKKWLKTDEIAGAAGSQEGWRARASPRERSSQGGGASASLSATRSQKGWRARASPRERSSQGEGASASAEVRPGVLRSSCQTDAAERTPPEACMPQHKFVQCCNDILLKYLRLSWEIPKFLYICESPGTDNNFEIRL